jgi:hypothetical protein
MERTTNNKGFNKDKTSAEVKKKRKKGPTAYLRRGAKILNLHELKL